MAGSLNRILDLDFNMEELALEADEFTKETYLNKLPFNRKFYVDNFFDALKIINTIHENEKNFKSFLTIVSRAVVLFNEKEIEQNNLLEILYKECFISSTKIRWSNTGNNQYAMAVLLRYLAINAEKEQMIHFMNRYPHHFKNSENPALYETYREITR